MSPLRVLVVDDEAAIRETLLAALEDEGHQVVSAPDGEEALRVVERERPDLVLLDMRMPVLDGWGFAREMRARGLSIPIVVMTAAHNAARWAEEIGADAQLPKPFLLDDLFAVVDRFRAP